MAVSDHARSKALGLRIVKYHNIHHKAEKKSKSGSEIKSAILFPTLSLSWTKRGVWPCVDLLHTQTDTLASQPLKKRCYGCVGGSNSLDTCKPHGLHSISSFHGIIQARILEGVSISYSRGSSQPRDHCATGSGRGTQRKVSSSNNRCTTHSLFVFYFLNHRNKHGTLNL